MRNPALLGMLLLLAACDPGDRPNASGGPTQNTTPVVAATAADASIAGPYSTVDVDYDFGRMTVHDEITGDSYESDIHGYIRYPEDAEGPFPVLLFQHGRHQTCETGIGQLPVLVGDDNCPNLAPVITPANSYRGYDYLAENLASHGYAVISIDTNDVNDNDGSAGSSDTGALARAELIMAHLDAFRDINRQGGPDFDQLTGKLDLERIGIMGHSRGGEGVNKTITVNAARDNPHALHAVFALAPTDYVNQAVEGVVFATLLPYCDGDVEDLMGSFAYDNARYADPADPWPKFQILTMGANHNYFNTIWTSDDWEIHGTATDSHCGTQSSSNQRDTPEGQRALGQFFMASFFRYFIGQEEAFADYWSGLATVPGSACPDGAAPCDDRYHLSVHPGQAQRLVVENTLTADSLQHNALNLPVTFDGFADYGHCTPEGRSGEGCAVAEPTFSTAGQVYLSWEGPAVYRTELGGLDVRGLDVFSLRVGVSLGDAANSPAQDFDIVFIDRSGSEATVAAASLGAALFDPPGDTFSVGGSEKTTLNGLHAPLALFNSVDLSQLQAIELRFGTTDAGTIQLTDLMFRRL